MMRSAFFQCAADGRAQPLTLCRMALGFRLRYSWRSAAFRAGSPRADQSGLHAVLRADKQDLAVRTALEQHARNGKGGLMCPPVPPQVNTAFMGLPPLTYLGLWVMLRDTFSTMPFSASCMMSAVPP